MGKGIQALAEKPLARFGLGDHLQLQQRMGQVDILVAQLGATIFPLARCAVEPAGKGKLGQMQRAIAVNPALVEFIRPAHIGPLATVEKLAELPTPFGGAV